MSVTIDRVTGETTTSGAATAVLISYPVPQNRSLVIEAHVTGYTTADPTGASGHSKSVTVTRATGSPTIVGSSSPHDVVPLGLLGASFALAISGNNVEVRVTGSVLVGTIQWAGEITVRTRQ